MLNVCRYLQSLFLMKYKNNTADYSIAASQSDSEKLSLGEILIFLPALQLLTP